MADHPPSAPPSEPEDADDTDAHVPAELVELHEVLQWQAAIAEAPE